MFKALRTIPVILDIDKDMSKLCPNAWMINFTNPAGMVTEALLRYGKNKKVMGLCNVPIGMEKAAAKVLEVEHKRLRMDFVGLNHMVFGKEVYVDGVKITDKLINLLADGNIRQIVKNISDFTWNKDFIKALGMMPCPYHKYYFQTKDMLKEELEQFSKGKTRAEIVKKVEEELFELYKNENLDIKPPELEKRGGAYYSDAACRLICSIYNDKKDVQPVNVRNNGAIIGIPNESAIEISCMITRDGPKAIAVGELPIAINGLIQQIKTFERLVVDSAVFGDYYKAILALTVNPLVQSDKLAKTLVDELMIAHKDYLPQFKGLIEENFK